VEEALARVTYIRECFERNVGQNLFDWVQDRDWEALECLAAWAKATPKGEFKVESVSTPQSTELKPVMVHAFVELSECGERSLLYGVEPHPNQLPTKKAFDLKVKGRFKSTKRSSEKWVENLENQIKRCRKALGFDGLPNASELR